MTVIILFVSSASLIVTFLLLKHLEQRRGLRLFEVSRGKMDVLVERGTFYVTHVLPKRVVYRAVGFATTTAHISMLILLRGVRVVEHKLLGVSNAVRGRKEIHRRQASNSYLESVTNHKKQLVQDRKNGDLGRVESGK